MGESLTSTIGSYIVAECQIWEGKEIGRKKRGRERGGYRETQRERERKREI